MPVRQPGDQLARAPELFLMTATHRLLQRYALHLDNRAGDCAKRAATCMIYLRCGSRTHHTPAVCYSNKQELQLVWGPAPAHDLNTMPSYMPLGCTGHPLFSSDVEAGGATYFPRSTGFSLHKALEACAAG